ncbi:MAG TPA: 50S ribosomal protein L9 [Bacteroidota bacterium]|jgi:large subunit ribosomal protein L9|nr:50S ribosomal protein L9 [Bacteroidota bacterium]
MKIILRKDVDTLGKVGDVVSVKDGYARNYLIPIGIAFEATEGALRQVEEEKKQQVRRLEKERTNAENLAVQLEKISITIKMKVGEEEKLFGSVTAQMIADALTEKGITIDKRLIELEEPLKALGIYDVPIKLQGGVTSKIKVWIVRE